MTIKKHLYLLAFVACVVCCGKADAAAVGFIGSVDDGNPGFLGSLPRNFTLVLDYTPNPVGGAPATGNFFFDPTPNSNTSNPDTNSGVIAPAIGNIAVIDNMSGSDILAINGNVAAGILGPTQVNFAFSFSTPADTVDSKAVTPESLALLIRGSSTITFISGAGSLNAVGSIVGAPEPSTMIALTGLVCGGCGIGFRRRMKAKSKRESISDEEDC